MRRKGVQVYAFLNGTEPLVVPLWRAWGRQWQWWKSEQTEALCGEAGSARGDVVVQHGYLCVDRPLRETIL